MIETKIERKPLSRYETEFKKQYLEVFERRYLQFDKAQLSFMIDNVIDEIVETICSKGGTYQDQLALVRMIKDIHLYVAHPAHAAEKEEGLFKAQASEDLLSYYRGDEAKLREKFEAGGIVGQFPKDDEQLKLYQKFSKESVEFATRGFVPFLHMVICMEQKQSADKQKLEDERQARILAAEQLGIARAATRPYEDPADPSPLRPRKRARRGEGAAQDDAQAAAETSPSASVARSSLVGSLVGTAGLSRKG